MQAFEDIATQLLEQAKQQQITICTAESCTGGMVAASITDIAGSSSIFDRGFVTYTNQAKSDMLGVPMHLINNWGAVNPQTAAAMATGALRHANADICVAITGVAGPDRSEHKPAGLVYFGFAFKNQTAWSEKHNFTGNRDEVRQAATKHALLSLISILKNQI